MVRTFLVIIFFPFFFSFSDFIEMSDLLLLSVLPKFSVKLSVPPYILKTNNRIQINITTR